MQSGQRLSERLDSINDFGPEDILWAHFVFDHRKYITRNSQKRNFVPEELIKYKYRPQDFVEEICHCPIRMTWIFLHVNDIRDPADFNENCRSLYIIDAGVINHLYELYSTSANRAVA